ncbi:MAG: ABC transporter permease, partial [Acidimicrobiales bacterium]
MSTTEAAAPAPAPASPPHEPGRIERLARRLTEANLAVVVVLAVLLGLVVGAILIVTTTGQSFGGVGSAYAALFKGAILNPSSVGHAVSTGHGWNAVFTPLSETLVAATPLIFSGLGVAIGFATGVFNIGGQGQVVAGAICATYVGFGVHLPVWVHLPLVVLAGAAGGALAGFVPGILKARTGAHEVIVTIMLNYIFLYLLSYLLVTAPLQQPGQSNSISRTVPQSARLPFLFGGGLRVNAGFLLAMAAVGG